MTNPDPIEAAHEAFDVACATGKKDFRVCLQNAIAAYLRAEAVAMTAGMTTGKSRMLAGFLREKAAGIEREQAAPK